MSDAKKPTAPSTEGFSQYNDYLVENFKHGVTNKDYTTADYLDLQAKLAEIFKHADLKAQTAQRPARKLSKTDRKKLLQVAEALAEGISNNDLSALLERLWLGQQYEDARAVRHKFRYAKGPFKFERWPDEQRQRLNLFRERYRNTQS